MTFYLGGNSHISALREAQRIGPEPTLPISVQIVAFGPAKFERKAFARIQRKRVRVIADDMRERLLEGTGLDHFEAGQTWGLCMGTQHVLLLGSDLWHDAAPAALNLPGVRPISDGVIDAMIDAEQTHVIDFFGMLRRIGARVFGIDTPAVRRDGMAIAKGTPPEVVAYLSRRAKQRFEARLAAEDIPFVTSPPETMDADGFLREDFGQAVNRKGREDGYHANRAYGALMLDRIAAELRAFEPADA